GPGDRFELPARGAHPEPGGRDAAQGSGDGERAGFPPHRAAPALQRALEATGAPVGPFVEGETRERVVPPPRPTVCGGAEGDRPAAAKRMHHETVGGPGRKVHGDRAAVGTPAGPCALREPSREPSVVAIARVHAIAEATAQPPGRPALDADRRPARGIGGRGAPAHLPAL